jgi:hypothetical protein
MEVPYVVNRLNFGEEGQVVEELGEELLKELQTRGRT